MRYFFYILFLLFVHSAFAQKTSFRGFIKSSDDFEPVALVQVKNMQNGQIVWSDETGFFEISAIAGTKLEFSRVGITTRQLEVSPAMLKTIQQIILKYDVAALDAVTVQDRTS